MHSRSLHLASKRPAERLQATPLPLPIPPERRTHGRTRLRRAFSTPQAPVHGHKTTHCPGSAPLSPMSHGAADARARPCRGEPAPRPHTRSGEGRRAAACASALAIRTPVPSITRVGLKIVARLRLQAPAVLGGLRAVWRVRGPPRRGVMIRRPRPCRCFGGPKSTAVLVNDLGRTLKNAATSRETSIPHLVRAGVGLSKYFALMPALGEAFAPAVPAGGAGTSSGIFHSLGGWTMVGVDGAAVVLRGGRRVGPHVGRKEALGEGPRRHGGRWRKMKNHGAQERFWRSRAP